MKQKIQSLKGFRDFLPDMAKKRQWLAKIMQDTAELWGYEPIETPTLEPLELFAGEIGEDEKLFFKFTDYGDRQIALRYDQTVPTCRFVANHLNDLNFPFRRYQFQPVFRAEKPQRGRYREFIQFDIDIFGIASPLADAEAIALTIATYQAIGFKSVVVSIGSRTLMKDIPYKAIVAIDKLQKIGSDGVIQEMISQGIDSNQASSYLTQVQNLQPDKDLKTIFNYLADYGFAASSYRFEPTLARSFSYSDGPIWEIVIPEYTAGSVGGGERYDGMMKRITGKDISGTGIAFGFDRTLEAAEQLALTPSSTAITKVLVTIFDLDLMKRSLNLATQLRAQQINTQVFPDPQTKLDKQLKYANKQSIPLVIIIGPEEVAKGVITLKDMRTGQQTTDKINNLIQLIQS